MKSSELKNTKKLVKKVLTEDKQTRNSDMLLYVKVCERINPESLNEPFWYVLSNLKEFGLPNMETVRRTRQKIQEEMPFLCGNSQVEGQRLLNEQVFRDFARGNY